MARPPARRGGFRRVTSNYSGRGGKLHPGRTFRPIRLCPGVKMFGLGELAGRGVLDFERIEGFAEFVRTGDQPERSDEHVRLPPAAGRLPRKDEPTWPALPDLKLG